MAARTRGYAHRLDVQAPRKIVWRSLIEPALLAQWYGPDARITPRAGGRYSIRADEDLVREAHIDVCDPGRRLRLIYMPAPELPATDSVIVDDFLLDDDGVGTTLRLLGSGFPDTGEWEHFYRRMRGGWPRALGRLKLMVEQLSSQPAG
jgi:uncharacterized protein YndB with AHSA1/START domain